MGHDVEINRNDPLTVEYGNCNNTIHTIILFITIIPETIYRPIKVVMVTSLRSGLSGGQRLLLFLLKIDLYDSDYMHKTCTVPYTQLQCYYLAAGSL